LLAYSIRVSLFARLDWIIDESKLCATAGDSRTNPRCKKLSTPLVLPASSCFCILAASKGKHIAVKRRSRDISRSSAESFSEFGRITDSEDRCSRISSHVPRREQNAGIGALGRSRRHPDHEFVDIPTLYRL